MGSGLSWEKRRKKRGQKGFFLGNLNQSSPSTWMMVQGSQLLQLAPVAPCWVFAGAGDALLPACALMMLQRCSSVQICLQLEPHTPCQP